MNSIALRVLTALAAALAVLSAFWYVQSLRAELETARKAEKAAIQIAVESELTIKALRQMHKENDQARAKLETDRNGIRSNLATRELMIRELQNENKELRDWSSVRLPGVIIGMRDHPAATGAADYRERVRQGDALHTSGGNSEE